MNYATPESVPCLTALCASAGIEVLFFMLIFRGLVVEEQQDIYGNFLALNTKYYIQYMDLMKQICSINYLIALKRDTKQLISQQQHRESHVLTK
jgi:hypothetical protein